MKSQWLIICLVFVSVNIWKLYLFSLSTELMAESSGIPWQFLEQRVAVKAGVQGRIINPRTLTEFWLESLKVGQINIFLIFFHVRTLLKHVWTIRILIYYNVFWFLNVFCYFQLSIDICKILIEINEVISLPVFN